jgi:hypothetical protein
MRRDSMGGKGQNNQLRLAFGEESRSEAPMAPGEGSETHTAKRMTESPANHDEQLMEEVCGRENCLQAFKRVKSNKGSPGIDGMTVEQLTEHLKEHWPAIREQLLAGTYKPQPVKRVEIPKPDGGVRQLGIPTVLDRMVQQAVMQVLQARWDAEFSDHSHGFRTLGASGGSQGAEVHSHRPLLGGGSRFGEVLRPGQPRQADGVDSAPGDGQEDAQADPGVPHRGGDGERAGGSCG